MDEYEKFLNLFSTKIEERNEKSKQTEKTISNLQYKTNELKFKLFSNLSLTYISSKSDIEDCFGELLVKVSLYLNSLLKYFSFFKYFILV
jgi:hypothetical protein